MAKSELISFKQIVADIAKAQNKWTKATKVTATSLKNMAKDLSKAEQSAKKFNKSQQLSVADSKSLDKILKKLGSTITKNINTSIKSAEAEKKSALATQKRIDTQRKAMNQSEAVRKNLSLKAQALKKVKQQQDLDILNNQKANAVNIKYAKIIERTNRSLFSFTKSAHKGALGVSHLRNASEGGGMALSVLRSKLLIVAFGFNLLQRSVGKLVSAYGEQEAAEMKVKATLASTGMAAGMTFREIKKLTQELQRNGVIGDETNLQMASLMLTYDQIGRETFPAAMKAANDMATSLAMGIPTTEELKSTVTMLSKALQDPERGMTALRKVGFSLSAMQEKQVKTFMHLGKTAKAQNIILKASEKQYGNMAKIIASSTLGQLNAMTMAMGDMSEEMGKALAPAMIKVADFLKAIAERLDPSAVRGLTTAIVALGSSYIVLRLNTMMHTRALAIDTAAKAGATIGTQALTRATWRLNVAIKANPYLLTIGAVLTLIPLIKGLSGGYKKAADEAQDFADAQLDVINNARILDNELTKRVAIEAYEEQKKKLEELNNVVNEYTDTTLSFMGTKTSEVTRDMVELANGQTLSKAELIALIATQEVEVERLNQLRLALGKNVNLLSKEEGHIIKLTDSQVNQLAVLQAVGDEQKALVSVANQLGLTYEQLITTHDGLTESVVALVAEQTKQKEMAMAIDEIQQMTTAFIQAGIDERMSALDAEKDADIARTKASSEYKRAQKRGDLDTMERLEKEASKKTLDRRKKEFRASQMLAVGNIVIDFMQAYGKELAKLGVLAFVTTHPFLIAAEAAMIGTVMSQKPPTMERGGLIGGRRHSQGGTMIEAEQGEFIMSRSAVQSVGLENLNRMNEGGGSSSVTVNVSGNVMTEEFTAEQVIPAIREALRRGENLDHKHSWAGMTGGITSNPSWE